MDFNTEVQAGGKALTDDDVMAAARTSGISETNCVDMYGAHKENLLDFARAILAAQAGQEKTYPACNGNNCGTTDGKSHSQECFAEHDACVSTGSNLLDTAGNRNPEHRYAGYSGEPCGKSASEDQRKAWKEGCDSALRPPALAQPERVVLSDEVDDMLDSDEFEEISRIMDKDND